MRWHSVLMTMSTGQGTLRSGAQTDGQGERGCLFRVALAGRTHMGTRGGYLVAQGQDIQVVDRLLLAGRFAGLQEDRQPGETGEGIGQSRLNVTYTVI